MSVFERFAERAGLSGSATLPEVVAAVQAIPYGRPRSRTVDGVLADWCGTCSTKHALLADLLDERWPELRPRLVHRVYRVEPEPIRRRYGAAAGAAVPADGLLDVHRYLVISAGGADVVLDVTFPDDAGWDGRSSMRVACAPGEDFPAGPDPAADKAALEARYCDPAVREPFIAALVAAGRS